MAWEQFRKRISIFHKTVQGFFDNCIGLRSYQPNHTWDYGFSPLKAYGGFCFETGSKGIEVVIIKAFLGEEPLGIVREVQAASRIGFEERFEKFFADEVVFAFFLRSGKWLVNGNCYVSSHYL